MNAETEYQTVSGFPDLFTKYFQTKKLGELMQGQHVFITEAGKMNA